MLNRKFHNDFGAAAARLPKMKCAAVLLDSFAHAGDSDAGTIALGAAGSIGADANAVVRNLEQDRRGVLTDPDDALAGFGVAMNVGERFLYDAEQSDLQVAGHAWLCV